MALHKLVFDATDANTQAASANVGAYLRASDGTLITHTGGALDVNIATSDISIDVELDQANDTVAVGDGTNLISLTASGEVKIVDNGNSITVDSTDFDIRDLAFATDSVDVSGSEVSLDSATLAALENITVSATDLDIRDLAFATDSVDVSGSEVSLDSATLAALENITVSATDLDIRDLTHASDSVKVGDGTDFLAVNADGSINVNSTAASPAALSTVAETVGTSAAAIVDGGDELANRKKLFMYNNGNRQMYIGATGVTTSTGFPIPPGSILEIESGAAMDVFAIADAAGQNMRTLQLA
jgi:hypothetical protein